MKNTTTIILIVLSFGLLSCNSKTEKKPIKQTILVDKLTFNKGQINEKASISESDPDNECTRGAAEPIIKKSVFPKTKFKLQSDKFTGIETVDFDNGDKLIIKNWGCESYVLTFRFETSRFEDKTTDIPFSFNMAVLLVSELYEGLDAPIDIKKGVQAIVKYVDADQLNNYQNLKFGEEIDFGGDDIRDFVTVDKIEKLKDKKYAIEISFTTGPL